MTNKPCKTSTAIMHMPSESPITKDSNLKNHVPIVAVNPTNLLNVLEHALPWANPVSIVIPNVTLPMFAENQKNQNQLTPSLHKSHIKIHKQLQYQQSTSKI